MYAQGYSFLENTSSVPTGNELVEKANRIACQLKMDENVFIKQNGFSLPVTKIKSCIYCKLRFYEKKNGKIFCLKNEVVGNFVNIIASWKYVKTLKYLRKN